MYRLLKIASSNNSLLHIPPLSCSLCNGRSSRLAGESAIFRNNILSRNLSTEDLKKLHDRIKKIKKRKTWKKCVELVEVKLNDSKLTGVPVRKLKAGDVKKLSEQPSLSLEQFHQVLNTNNSKSKKSLSSSTKPTLHDDNDLILKRMKLALVNDEVLRRNADQETQWNVIEHDTENIDVYSSTDPQFNVSLKTGDQEILIPKKRKKKRIKNAETGAKNVAKSSELSETETNELRLSQIVEKFNGQLASYIELCVNCGQLDLAFRSLKRYVRIQSHKPLFSKLDSSQPFNALLSGFAAKANMSKVLIIKKWMTDIGIEWDPQTFVACFECSGRLPESEQNIELLRMFQNEMESMGFIFDDLMLKDFVGDQRDYVLKSIKKLQPNFKFDYPSPEKYYYLGILQELNSRDTPYHSTVENLISYEQLKKGVEEQMNIESKRIAEIRSAVAPSVVTPEVEFYREKWKEVMNKWRSEIKDVFIKKRNDLHNELICTRKCLSINIYPYLTILTEDQYVDILMLEIHRLLSSSEVFSPILKSLRKNLGEEVGGRYIMKMKEKSGMNSKMSKLYEEYCKWFIKPELNKDSRNTRHQWETLIHGSAHSGPAVNYMNKRWPATITFAVGKFLYEIILNDVKFDGNIINPDAKEHCLQPAFHRIFRYQSGILIEEIKPNPILFKLHKDSKQENLFFDISMLPMLSPPIPWTNVHSGGYLHTKVNLIRWEGFMRNPVDTCPDEKMHPIFDSLNQLSAVPWKINKPVLDVMLEVFRKGGSNEMNVPLSADAFMDLEEKNNSNRNLSYNERFMLCRRKAEMYSLWCESLYRLSIADHFRDRIFWFPHNLDFRGRVYPVPPYLTHLGSDLARCLLVFARGEKLGPNGLDWLKIHCINLTGLKKREPSVERLRYANEILPQILDSAENPLTGEKWWTQSEDMWQTLACCLEIKAAIDSGDPENYICHFPVHQDGSCNGLQHYAALGRDEIGARSVNLTPCDTPQDVYSCVVALVEKKRQEDARNGIEIAQALEGCIKRKVIKQTIMTTVYGVTKYGGRLQIAKQLEDVEDLPKQLVWKGSRYLVDSTFICLANMFSSAKQIQDWFNRCAKYISSDCGRCVEWETPLGLPIIQPYCAKKKITHAERTNEVAVTRILVPDKMKQRNAFPPNYVHSLDSSHMMLTSLYCEKEGIAFVSVHDCFWTHPSTVGIMNKICREQFVALHSLPLLETLSESFIRFLRENHAQTIPKVFVRIPRKGDFELRNVLESEYFFS